MKPRILALDYGEKRVGIAVSDPFGTMAFPLDFIENNESLLSNINQLIAEYDIEKILCGLPKHTQAGKSTKKEEDVRIFSEKLNKETGLDIMFWDERFSTVAVRKQFKDHDINRKKRKKMVDSSAAAFILQGYLDKESM